MATWVQIPIPEEILPYLDQLEATCLYGRGLEEVVGCLLSDALRRKLESGILFRLMPFSVPEEAPESPPPADDLDDLIPF